MTRNLQATRAVPSAPSASSEEGLGVSVLAAAVGYFVLAVLYFFPIFLPDRQFFGTDYLAGGYFFYNFIAERLAAGELPKWVPYVYGGLPLFANPGSTYHPVFFLTALLFPVQRALAAVFLFHFWVAGLGMFLLGRELGARPWVAALAGLAWQFTGITASWVFAGHDGRIIVATLAPMFFYFLHRAVRTGRLLAFLGVAGTLALALLSFQIQNAYYLLLAGAIWAIFCVVHLGLTRRPRDLVRTVGLGLAAVGFAFVLAAVNFLPFRDYVEASPRGASGGRGYEYSVSFSMPPADIVGLAVPEQSGVSVYDPETGEAMFPAYVGPNAMKLHTEYVGAFVVVLLALGAVYGRRSRYWWFFLGVAVFFLSLALGGHTPLYRFYYEVLPGLKRFRAPDLAYYVVAFSLVTMAAITLERLASLRAEAAARPAGARREEPSELRHLPAVVAGVVGLAVLGALLASGAPAQVGEPSRAGGWIRFAVFAGLVGAALWAFVRGHVGARGAALLLAVVTAVDLWVIDKRFLHTAPPPEVVFAPDDVVQFLRGLDDPGRVWVLPFGGQVYRNHSNYLMYYGIEQAGGEHGNHIQRYGEYVGAGRETYVDWHNFMERPQLMAAANIRHIVSMVPLDAPVLREVHRGSALVYENVSALPRAYLVPKVVGAADEDASLELIQQPTFDPRRVAVVTGDAPDLPAGPLAGAAEVVEQTPDRVAVRTRADREAFLVLAANAYDGWKARIGDTEIPVRLANHAFRGVVVPAGEHTVVFTFEPEELFRGLWIYGVGLLLFVAATVILVLRERREGPTAA